MTDLTKLSDRVVELSQKMEGLVEKEGWDALVSVAFFNSLSEVVIGVLCLIITFAFYRLGRWTYAKGRIAADRQDEDTWITLTIFSGALCVAFGSAAVIILGETWNWVGLFNPETLAAKNLLTSVM